MDVRYGLCDSIGKIGSSRGVGVNKNDQDKLARKKNEYKQVQNNKYCKVKKTSTERDIIFSFKNHL